MRRGVLLFLIINLAIVIFLVHTVWTLITLLFVDGSADAITRAELPDVNSLHTDARPQLIPKIIHQTYINTSIPEVWQGAQRSCLDLHLHQTDTSATIAGSGDDKDNDWQYILWTDAMALSFISEHYPWFLQTFMSYPYPIQRADSIRYFVLAHHGGIYLDLDDGCARNLYPLLAYPAWLRRTVPTGISNDAMGSVPHHPFFERVIKELQNYDRRWILPYLTVMASTGPLFLSVLWRKWSMEGLNTGDGPLGGRVRVLMPKEYNDYSWSFFTHHLGNSWHGGDVEFIFWMARNWLPLTLLGFLAAIFLFLSIYWAYTRYILPQRQQQKQQHFNTPFSSSSEPPAPKWKIAASSSLRSRFPLLFGFGRRLGLGGFGGWGRWGEYELVERREV